MDAEVYVEDNTNVWPPYKGMVYCQSADLEIDLGLIALFDDSVPSGWTRFSALDGYFARGAPTLWWWGRLSDTHAYHFGRQLPDQHGDGINQKIRRNEFSRGPLPYDGGWDHGIGQQSAVFSQFQ